jgi:hypothetical protein
MAGSALALVFTVKNSGWVSGDCLPSRATSGPVCVERDERVGVGLYRLREAAETTELSDNATFIFTFLEQPRAIHISESLGREMGIITCRLGSNNARSELKYAGGAGLD